MKNIYKTITNQIIADLENNHLPWEQPWDGTNIPTNLKSKKAYRGINILILWSMAMKYQYSSNYWLTFKQAKELGGTVKKKSKGTPILFYMEIVKKVENKETGEETEKKILIPKYYNVFNLVQTEGIKINTANENDFNPVSKAEDIIHNSGAVIKEGSSGAYYRSDIDVIGIPKRSLFEAVEGFYNTLFHELSHWTGRKDRLNRELNNKYGESKYAFEELVAELGASFLSSTAGLSYSTQHASYIKSWLKLLKGDSKAVIKAASLAQKACDYVLTKCDGSSHKKAA